MNKLKFMLLIPLFCAFTIYPMLGLLNGAVSVADHSIKRSDSFFDLDNKDTLKDHSLILKGAICKVSAVIKKACNLYKLTNDNNYLLILDILLPARSMMVCYYNVISKKYNNAMSLALALKKMIKRFNNSGVLGEFWAGMVELEIALSGKDLDVFYILKDTIRSYKVPSNIDCMIALNKFF